MLQTWIASAGISGDCSSVVLLVDFFFCKQKTAYEMRISDWSSDVCSSGHKALPNRLAVGMIFLPRTDLGAQETCRTIVETEVISAGCTISGWRQVPVDVSVIGQKAPATRPEIAQIMIAAPMHAEQPEAAFANNLDMMPRQREK